MFLNRPEDVETIAVFVASEEVTLTQLECDKDCFNYFHPATFKIWAFGRHFVRAVHGIHESSHQGWDKSLRPHVSLRPPSNINRNIGAHEECMSVNLKLCPDFE
jgi:hypothetical protein